MRAFVLPAVILATAVVAACDEPRSREPKLNPRPVAPDNLSLPPTDFSPENTVERPSPFAWDPAAKAFLWNGQPLRAARTWTFDGSTDGFVMGGGEVAPAEEGGLRIAARVVDSAVRTPSGLALQGRRYTHVLVRATRLAGGTGWDGALYYATEAHPESVQFTNRPFEGEEPEVNETVILAYDMSKPLAGGEDWTASVIDRVRIDLDEAAGGEFLIHQVAITEPPAPENAIGLRPAT
ncbi:hypothetical protein [Phenylobacterium sp.]|uniref:hypothetical protein n=1 Tax=Phenylobacterium sp. TaxID=1871053 RepID=UPI002730E0B8|nr:hypothetical protein [Phenylobacterium sp.]MDP1617884.1 hypothetical protein [Phenylobacterium sp.]MDP1986819.1 hypothetical protein [Phenylobacterium sp.]